MAVADVEAGGLALSVVSEIARSINCRIGLAEPLLGRLVIALVNDGVTRRWCTLPHAVPVNGIFGDRYTPVTVIRGK